MTTDPVRQLVAERPTMFDHRFAGMKPSFEVAEGIHGVESISNVYLINTADGDIQIKLKGDRRPTDGAAGGGEVGIEVDLDRAAGRARQRQEETRHVVAERLAERRHLERVGEPVVNEDAAGQRKYLRLVLQAAEGGRVDQPVAVALKLRAVVVA